MILVDNRNILRVKNRELLEHLTTIGSKRLSSNVLLEKAKSGTLTMKLISNGREIYLHSKYDPEKEAERLIANFEEDRVNAVLFIGVGLGFHIEKFIKSHPNTKYAIYEPNEEVLLTFLENMKFEDYAVRNLLYLFTGSNKDHINNEMKKIIQMANGILNVITLPVYERIYKREIENIKKNIVISLKEKRNSLAVNVSFQKRWTINSIKNFPLVLRTPNILHDINKEEFKAKPALIVAAGPSLNEEFENLRYIKENGLAYIFSVGSAINALIEHGIYPDAACTYDPSDKNKYVIQKIKDENITDIPLIFGSSVGFETLEGYPGSMFHMITNQDSISPQLLDTSQSISILLDAPSIAAITFQLLTELGCNLIVLVGQNLGYRENKRYASGINYDFINNELSEIEKENSIKVKDVYGNLIQSNEGFNQMRQQLEMYISANSHVNVINTTRGGAQIEGTTFVHLDELIKKQMNANIVNSKWLDANNSYDLEFTKTQLLRIRNAIISCGKLLQKLLTRLNNINDAVEKRLNKNIEKDFAAFDNDFKKLKQNSFYKGFIEPMVRVQNERLSEESQLIRYETDLIKKAEVVVYSFTKFIDEVNLHVEFVKPYFEEMKERIEKG